MKALPPAGLLIIAAICCSCAREKTNLQVTMDLQDARYRAEDGNTSFVFFFEYETEADNGNVDDIKINPELTQAILEAVRVEGNAILPESDFLGFWYRRYEGYIYGSVARDFGPGPLHASIDTERPLDLVEYDDGMATSPYPWASVEVTARLAFSERQQKTITIRPFEIQNREISIDAVFLDSYNDRNGTFSGDIPVDDYIPGHCDGSTGAISFDAAGIDAIDFGPDEAQFSVTRELTLPARAHFIPGAYVGLQLPKEWANQTDPGTATRVLLSPAQAPALDVERRQP